MIAKDRIAREVLHRVHSGKCKTILVLTSHQHLMDCLDTTIDLAEYNRIEIERISIPRNRITFKNGTEVIFDSTPLDDRGCLDRFRGRHYQSILIDETVSIMDAPCVAMCSTESFNKAYLAALVRNT